MIYFDKFASSLFGRVRTTIAQQGSRYLLVASHANSMCIPINNIVKCFEFLEVLVRFKVYIVSLGCCLQRG